MAAQSAILLSIWIPSWGIDDDRKNNTPWEVGSMECNIKIMRESWRMIPKKRLNKWWLKWRKNRLRSKSVLSSLTSNGLPVLVSGIIGNVPEKSEEIDNARSDEWNRWEWPYLALADSPICFPPLLVHITFSLVILTWLVTLDKDYPIITSELLCQIGQRRGCPKDYSSFKSI